MVSRIYKLIFLVAVIFPCFLFGQIELTNTEIDFSIATQEEIIEYLSQPERKTVSSRDNNGLLIATKANTWEAPSWMESDSTEITYDQNGNLIDLVTLKFENQQWIETFRRISIYNNDNKLLSAELFAGNGGGLEEQSKMEYTYDADGRQILIEYFLWNNGGYNPSRRENVTYEVGSLGEIVRWTAEVPQVVGWDLIDRRTNQVDLNGNLIEITNENWNGFQWVNSYRYQLTFNSDDQLSIYQRDYWLMTEWIADFRFVITYNTEGFRETDLTEYWDGIEWSPSSKFDFFYNTNNINTSILKSSWELTGWVPDYRSSYAYNAFDKVNYLLRETYDGLIWENDIEVFYYYETVLADKLVSVTTENLRLFPNPSNGELNLFLEVTSGEKELEIFDAFGRLVYSELLDGDGTSESIDITHLSTGVYWVSVSSAGRVWVNSVIVE